MDGRLTRRGACAALAVAAWPWPARAADEPLQAELVKTGLYLVTGGGSHALLRLSPAGAVLVNAKQAGMHPPLMVQLRRISRLTDLPVRVLALTGVCADEAANQALLAQRGVATLVPRAGREALGRLAPAAADPAPGPVVAYDDVYRLAIGGIELRLEHVGAVHSAADSVVLFPDLRVLAAGALCADVPADIPADRLARWAGALDRALALDFDLVVPHQGPLLARDALRAQRSRIEVLQAAAGAGGAAAAQASNSRSGS